MTIVKRTQPSHPVQDDYQSILGLCCGRRGRNSSGNVLRQQTSKNTARHCGSHIDYARNDLVGVSHTCCYKKCHNRLSKNTLFFCAMSILNHRGVTDIIASYRMWESAQSLGVLSPWLLESGAEEISIFPLPNHASPLFKTHLKTHPSQNLS